MRNLQTGLMVLLAAMLIHLTAGATSGAVTDPANTATVSVTSAYAKGGEEVSVFVTVKIILALPDLRSIFNMTKT